jgi:hypothetical protein
MGRTYDELLYGQLRIHGTWKFNDDSTKFGEGVSQFDGKPVNDMPIAIDLVIIRLTADSLIYGHEGYYGTEGTYGHDDLYFIRADR